MLRYQSDWPEVGATAAWVGMPDSATSASPRCTKRRCWQDAQRTIEWSLQATPNRFETALYRVPIWELCLEVTCANDDLNIEPTPTAEVRLDEAVSALLFSMRAARTYVYAKAVPTEPLYASLLRTGFAPVEHRRLYTCSVRDLATVEASKKCGTDISFCTLEQTARSRHAEIRTQLLAMCRESFESGNSRHFVDPFLSDRRTGLAYISALMHLNFANISPRHFLLALDNADGTVCGFCVLGSKPAVNSKTFTQLLSITRPSHRRRGIYQGLSRLIGSAVSTSATLLNVTHAQNIAIQQAYQQSGRAHVADTVVIRRVLSSTDRR